MSDPNTGPHAAGDIVDVTLARSIVLRAWKSGPNTVLEILTTDGKYVINADAADVTVTKTGTRRTR